MLTKGNKTNGSEVNPSGRQGQPFTFMSPSWPLKASSSQFQTRNIIKCWEEREKEDQSLVQIAH